MKIEKWICDACGVERDRYALGIISIQLRSMHIDVPVREENFDVCVFCYENFKVNFKHWFEELKNERKRATREAVGISTDNC